MSSIRDKPKTEPKLIEILLDARTIWRKFNGKNCTTDHENRMFRESFGCGPNVAFVVWHMMWKHAMIPDGSCILHFLWTLMFMKDYGKSIMMATIAGTCPKTFRKWVWRNILAISSLENIVVSNIAHILFYVPAMYSNFNPS